MLIISMVLLLLSNATTNRRDLSISFNRSLVNILLLAFIIGLSSNSLFTLKEGFTLLGGLFHNNSLKISFHLFILLVTMIIVQLTAFYPMKYINNKINKDYNIPKCGGGIADQIIDSNKTTYVENIVENINNSNKIKEQYRIIEYPLIILFVIIGAILLISSRDLLSFFIAIELQSYGLYLICALYRNSEGSTKASLYYFLLGGLSSCFILLALILLYTYSGTSSLTTYYMLASLSDNNEIITTYWYNNNFLNFSLIILSVGLLFKVSAAPFHFWSPDVYDAIPTVVTTFVANIAKISILLFLVEFVHYTGHLTISDFNWTNCLLLSSFLSLIVGTVLGLNQSRIKRLLAYSTISHLGFMLLAISISSIESTQAFLFYLMQYSITNINAFIIIISIGYPLYFYNKDEKRIMWTDENNSPLQYISQLKGYYHINPILAISLTIVIFSFVGIPPLVGFFGKQMVLSSALDKGYIFITLIAILTSVISAVYYLNVIKEIFSDQTKKLSLSSQWIFSKEITAEETNSLLFRQHSAYLSSNLSFTISVLTLIILLFMLSPEEWLSISNTLAMLLFN